MRELPSRIIVLSKRLKQQMKALLELCVCEMLPILKGWNVRKERNQPFFHFCNEPWTCLMNLMRGQGIFCVEGHTTSHTQTAHVGALAALSKNSITESQNIQGLFFFFLNYWIPYFKYLRPYFANIYTLPEATSCNIFITTTQWESYDHHPKYLLRGAFIVI